MTRFDFGRNWSKYLGKINDEKITRAKNSLTNLLRLDNLHDKSFLDAGCGSGLLSLAAIKLGAGKVFSFDFDENCVNCAELLNQKYGLYDNWEITQGSVLDEEWLSGLGSYDIVYSWGVLHHTGDMWRAVENICELVKPDGYLFVSIYNDRGIISKIWKSIKIIYNKSPYLIKMSIAIPYYVLMVVNEVISICVHRKPLRKWFNDNDRGMSLWTDCLDWCGGYPFETATPESMVDFLYYKGFSLINLKLKRGSGCNEFLFVRNREQ